MGDEDAVCARIVEHYRAGRFEEADAAARDAAALLPHSRRVALEYGLSALFRTDLLAAVTRFAVAWARFPECGEAFALASVALRRARQFASAGMVVEAGLAAAPATPLLHVERAWVATETGRTAEARAMWNGLRADFPETPEGYWVSSHLALLAGELDFADAVIRAGYARFPRHDYTLWQWARVASARGDWTEAARRWGIAQALHPEMAEIREGSRASEASRLQQQAAESPLPVVGSPEPAGDPTGRADPGQELEGRNT